MTAEPLTEPARRPLLTVAIPTFNRAGYLQQNLDQLRAELRDVPAGTVEILVSDNCSPDDTPKIVQAAVKHGLAIRYVRNATNLGWGPNFAQCFDLATGKYVILLGDDDVFVDGALARLLRRLAERDYGVVVLGSYGYDEDFRTEQPPARGEAKEDSYRDSNEFFVAVGPLMTLISACVINKSLLPGFSIQGYTTGDLAAFPLVLHAALAAHENLYIRTYMIGSKRQNSFNYDYGRVFVEEMWGIIDGFAGPGLNARTVRTIEQRMLLSYYPFYALDIRLHRRGDLKTTRQYFAARFAGRPLYRLWLAPTLELPRPLALAWGALTTLVGRVAAGELRRGVYFAWHKLRRYLPSRTPIVAP
jgi:abequosyltransferase